MGQNLPVVGITAKSAFDLNVERDVFEGINVELRAIDVESEADLMENFQDVDAVIDRLLAAPYTASVIDALNQCRVIARCGIGVDAIDVEAATDQGTYVVNVPSYCQHEVSEHAIMLVLSLQRNLIAYDTTLKNGEWRRNTASNDVQRLNGRVLGLVGFGSIARLVAEKAQALGMDVVATDPYVDAETMRDAGVEQASFEEVLSESDIVTLHTPLTDETEGMLDATAFDRMKDTAYLVNVARGKLVVEEDLIAALRAGDIAGAGLDVYEQEPADQGEGTPVFESPLADLENVVLTPHVAWFSQEANDERRETAARDVRRILSGEQPENPVNNPE